MQLFLLQQSGYRLSVCRQRSPSRLTPNAEHATSRRNCKTVVRIAEAEG